MSYEGGTGCVSGSSVSAYTQCLRTVERKDCEIRQETPLFYCMSRGWVRSVTLEGRPYDPQLLGRLQAGAHEKHTFWVGRDCTVRLILCHMLQHWEWHVAGKLTEEVKKLYHAVRPCTSKQPNG